MNIKAISIKKYLLIIAVALTASAPLLFVRLDEQTFNLNLFKLLAKAGSLCGTVLLVWQFLLGYRVIGGKLIQDFIWLLNVHKLIGKYGLALIVLHPIFITLYYLDKKDINLFAFGVGVPFDVYLSLGIAALVIILLVVVTSIFFRNKFDFKTWYGLHLTSYVALLMVFVHGLPIGQTLGETRLGIIWKCLFVFVIAAIFYRLLCQFGFFAGKYTIVKVKDVGKESFEIICRPIKNKIKPLIGQFVYFRRDYKEPGRPYTVSKYEDGKISITVKAQGSYSTGLKSLKTGRNVYIDGPYGIFSQEALENDRPLVMIAGGIGITPFYRILTEFRGKKRKMYLFYGSSTTDDIVYRNELEGFGNVKLVHVISNQQDYEGEKGYIDIGLLKKYIQQNLKECDFLLCGPPVMIVKIEEALSDAEIPASQIHHELFDF